MFAEVLLCLEPSRADILLVRRGKKSKVQVYLLKGLWELLGRYTILEYKSPVRSSFRRGDLIRLVSYGAQYHSRYLKKLVNSDELTLVLVVASLTPTLIGEIEQMGWTLEPLSKGYARVQGVMYACYIVVIDDVCQEERNDLLRAFSHHPVEDPEARSWISCWMKEQNMQPIRHPNRLERAAMRRDFIKRFPPDERLEGMLPQTMLRRISTEKLVVNLPIEMLRALSTKYIKTLPEDVQLKIQARFEKDDERQRRAQARAAAKSVRKVAPPTIRRSRTVA
ncbi:MAG TPA: hypothetical protein PK156_26055 [Polyangium sp.]|nr:hypothetical protein [Polyangium sp.]